MTPKAAVVVTFYHVGLMIGCSFGIYLVYRAASIDRVIAVGLYSVLSGALGGTLVASRYVVFKVKEGTYDHSRLLWQLLTPVHSALLAGIGIAAIHGGILLAASVPDPDKPQYTFFIIVCSFSIGLVSEVFVKRLITGAEALLGEAPRLGD